MYCGMGRLLALGPARVAGITLTTIGDRSDRHAGRIYPHAFAPGKRSTASSRAARTQGFGGGAGGAGGGAVSRRKRSTAATTAAASSGEAAGATISRRGRRLGTGASDDASGTQRRALSPNAQALGNVLRDDDGDRRSLRAAAAPARRLPPVGVRRVARRRRRARRHGAVGPRRGGRRRLRGRAGRDVRRQRPVSPRRVAAVAAAVDAAPRPLDDL